MAKSPKRAKGKKRPQPASDSEGAKPRLPGRFMKVLKATARSEGRGEHEILLDALRAVLTASPSAFALETVIDAPLKTLFPKQEWTDHALKCVTKAKLASIPVPDKWFTNSPADWVRLLAAMTKYESGFDPKQTYKENFKDSKGEYIVSAGLLQLSSESVAGYGFKATTNDLKDPFLNIEIAVAILKKLCGQDAVVAGNGKKPYKGGARYWSVLRASGRLDDVRKQYASQKA